MFKEQTHDVLNKFSQETAVKSLKIITNRFVDPTSDKHVFISHATKDDSHRIYEKVTTFLSAFDVPVFNPTTAFQRVPATKAAMAEQVRESQLVIAAMSHAFFESTYCLYEIQAAADAGIKVVCVFSGDYTSNAQMEAWIRGEM